MSGAYTQWIRKVGLFLFTGEKGLDLSEFHIKFSTQNSDTESPNNATIRVYNLAPATIKRIQGEFQNVSLNAGYENGNYGVVFQGSIKQFRIGRENATDTYLDILAADGDIGYNQGIVNTTLAKGTTQADAIKASVAAMPGGVIADTSFLTDKQHVPNIRGTVLFGMARARLRNIASSLDSSWSIQNGQVVFLSNTGYASGEAVKINVNTGLIGLPEQTDGGIKVKCLLNSRIRIGGLIQLNNAEIIQLMQRDPNAAPIAYNQWTGFQFNAPLSPDGIYRAYVVEHEGDSRGQSWYSHIVCLAVDSTQPQSKAVAPS